MASIRERKGTDGKTSGYLVRVRVKGHPPETATFRRLTDARRWATETEARLQADRHFTGGESRRRTMREALDRYERDVLPLKRPKTIRGQAYQIEYWRGRLGDLPIADVGAALVAECRDELLNGETRYKRQRSEAATLRYLALLSHVFAVAKKDWQWATHNPVLDIRKPREAAPRVVILTREERDRLLTECHAIDPMLHDIVITALCTGMRQAEILTLSWRNVDLERGRVTLDASTTKNKERRIVPLVGPALAALRERSRIRRIDADWVFPNPLDPGECLTRGTLWNWWVRARTRAKLPKVRFHDLRHVAASELAMHGVPLHVIAAILGHRTMAMTQRYSHLTTDYLADALTGMTGRMFAEPEAENE